MENYYDDVYVSIADKEQRGTRLSAQLSFIKNLFIRFKPGIEILDFCCGQGRHLYGLTGEGRRLTGIDNSDFLLSYANRILSQEVKLISADVREYRFLSEYDFIICMESSFNFNDTDALHVMSSLSEGLKAGGRILIHVFNPIYAMAHLPRKTWIDLDSALVLETREYVGALLTIHQKRLRKVHKNEYHGNDATIKFHLRNLEDFESLASKVNLELVEAYGSFDGTPPNPDQPELICILRHKE
jgi:D-alanine-D-alanine ligase